jgi:hypothetical protein
MFRKLTTIAIVLSAIAAAPLALALSGRYPTDAEMQQLIERIRGNFSFLRNDPVGVYWDRRDPEEIQEREEFVAAWAEVEPEIAPFLGRWAAVEEEKSIYPSDTPGQVCVIETQYVDTTFSTGTIREGRIYTSDNYILVLEEEFLGSAFIYENEPRMSPYSRPVLPEAPQPRTTPSQPGMEEYDRQYDDAVRQFQEHGCTAELPSR